MAYLLGGRLDLDDLSFPLQSIDLGPKEADVAQNCYVDRVRGVLLFVKAGGPAANLSDDFDFLDSLN